MAILFDEQWPSSVDEGSGMAIEGKHTTAMPF